MASEAMYMIVHDCSREYVKLVWDNGLYIFYFQNY